MHTLTTFGSAVAVALTLIASTLPQEPANGGRVTGSVIDAFGEGVTAARISAWRSTEPDVILHRTFTDGDGMFVLTNVAFDDRYSLWIRAESDERCGVKTAALVSSKQPERWCSLRLWDAGIVDVSVADGEGRPLTGVQVLATSHCSRILHFEPNAQGVTGADGHAVLAGVALGAIDVRAWLPDQPIASTTTWLHGAAAVELKLEDTGGVAMHVRVDGLPEEREAVLSILTYEDGGFIALPAFTNAITTSGGEWSMRALPDLRYLLSASLDGFITRPTEQWLEPGNAPHNLTFTVQPMGSVRLRGVLRDADGKPIAHETLGCRASNYSMPATGTTDAAGRFELDSALAAGEKAIFEMVGGRLTLHQEKTAVMYGVSDARFLGWHEFVIDPEPEYALTAIPAVSIEGRVVDSDGKPVHGRRVELQRSQPMSVSSWTVLESSVSDAEGRFGFRGVYPAPTPVRVSLGKLDAAASDPILVESGQDLRGIELRAVPLGVVEGRVSDEQGQPLPGARVWLRNFDPTTGRQTDGSVNEILSDREGRYRFVDVEPGGHRVELRTFGRREATVSSDFEVGPGAVLEMNLAWKH